MHGHRLRQGAAHHVYMKPCVSATSFHGWIRIPTTDAMTPPPAKVMRCGARFTSAFATGTTLAAMLVLRVATMSPVTVQEVLGSYNITLKT